MLLISFQNNVAIIVDVTPDKTKLVKKSTLKWFDGKILEKMNTANQDV